MNVKIIKNMKENFKKDEYFVRRDIVEEQTNHEENIFHDTPTEKNKDSMIFDYFIVDGEIVNSRNTEEYTNPENYLG